MKLKVSSSFTLVACYVVAAAAAAGSPSAVRNKREFPSPPNDTYAIAYPYATSPFGAAAVASGPQASDAPSYAVVPSYAASYAYYA